MLSWILNQQKNIFSTPSMFFFIIIRYLVLAYQQIFIKLFSKLCGLDFHGCLLNVPSDLNVSVCNANDLDKRIDHRLSVLERERFPYFYMIGYLL